MDRSHSTLLRVSATSYVRGSRSSNSEIKAILKEISTDQQSSKWQEVDQNSEEARRDSDIRFYCDNGM